MMGRVVVEQVKNVQDAIELNCDGEFGECEWLRALSMLHVSCCFFPGEFFSQYPSYKLVCPISDYAFHSAVQAGCTNGPVGSQCEAEGTCAWPSS